LKTFFPIKAKTLRNHERKHRFAAALGGKDYFFKRLGVEIGINEKNQSDNDKCEFAFHFFIFTRGFAAWRRDSE